MRYLNVPFSFLLWWLGFCLVCVGLEISYIHGSLEYIFLNDVTGLTWVVAVILIWQSFACCRALYDPDRFFDRKHPILERGWFFSDIVLSLGMVGTVIGFMMMLSGFAELDVTSAESAQEMITQLGMGMATALLTTLVGLIASILLKIQFFMLERELEKED